MRRLTRLLARLYRVYSTLTFTVHIQNAESNADQMQRDLCHFQNAESNATAPTA